MPKKTGKQPIEGVLSKSKGTYKSSLERQSELALLKELVKARIQAGKTQAQVAEAMGTTTSVVGRLETDGGKHKHSPTLETLRKYANALGYVLHLKLVSRNAPHHIFGTCCRQCNVASLEESQKSLF